MQNGSLKMGTLPGSWKEGSAKFITFCVTEDCNLACKYCYMTGKNNKNKMSFETAKTAVDYILSNKSFFYEEAVIWEFIGGEPFLEIELIDRICDYIKYRMYITGHPWFDAYRFSFSTNGLLYHLPKVQNFIMKNEKHVSIGFSVDGNKIKHDLQRVKPDGSGSYDEVMKNVPLWLKQFPGNSTKATFAHDDLPYLKDSIISLWDHGITTVAANVVFEDVWQKGDDTLFETQLIELADYVIENQLWNEYSVRFFDPNIGFPLDDETKQMNFCGSGKMLAIDVNGIFFPCVRFYEMCLNKESLIHYGDIFNGINLDSFRPFLGLSLVNQSPKECIDCEVATGCAWCTGYNYDAADTDTMYQRATFNCKMHKANVRASRYFWNRYQEVTGLESEMEKTKKERQMETQGKPIKYLQFITEDSITPACAYRNSKNTSTVMSRETLEKGLRFAHENGFVPVLLGVLNHDLRSYHQEYLAMAESDACHLLKEYIPIFDNNSRLSNPSVSGLCILIINQANICNLSGFIKELSSQYDRINIVMEDIQVWKDHHLKQYKKELQHVVTDLIEKYKKGEEIEVNVLTDILNSKTMYNCDMGENSLSLAPNGKIYFCPAFYFDDPNSFIGSIDEGINIKNSYLLTLNNAYLCSNCDAYHCKRCKFLNKKLTGEINTPSKIQCVISHIERNMSQKLSMMLQGYHSFVNTPIEVDYLDPYEKLSKLKCENL